MLWESIHKKEFCIISIYHHNIIIIYNLRVIRILVRVIKSLRCSIHIIIFNHCWFVAGWTVPLHPAPDCHRTATPRPTNSTPAMAPPANVKVRSRSWNWSCSFGYSTSHHFSGTGTGTPDFVQTHLLSSFSSYFQKSRFLVVTVRNRETKYYKLALLEKWLL